MTLGGPALLSSTLLARKGAAMPTGYAATGPQVGVHPGANENVRASGGPAQKRRDVRVALARTATPPTDAAERARVSVRLDRDRHLKLRLAAAHLHTSLQAVISDAIDRYLEEIGPEMLQSDCTCLTIGNRAAAADEPSL